MAADWTPGEIAEYDQGIASAQAELDTFARALRIGMAEVGEHQAVASVGKLIGQRDKRELVALLMAALLRASEQAMYR